ncbi:hypothetical protein BD413DRAFT_709717 [Trametes elegans]|nr:hypothetical protein BD413DRAFT_709717 [Trametes elegans]
MSASPLYAPLHNISEFRLVQWQYSFPNTSSNASVNALVRDVIHAPGFSSTHFREGYRIENALDRLDKAMDKKAEESLFSPRDGWVKTSIKIPVPLEGQKFASEADAPHYEVPNLYLRPLLDVLAAMLDSPEAANYHFVPFKLYFRPPPADTASIPFTSISGGPLSDDTSSHPKVLPHTNTVQPGDLRIRSEVYNGDRILREYDELLKMPRQPGDSPDLEYAILIIALWSDDAPKQHPTADRGPGRVTDSTHLTSFGTASLWPIYLYLANLSKYIRNRPTACSAQHLAYVPSLPDSFQDWYMEQTGTAPSAEMLTHCRRELMQAVWLLLLSPEFIHAYKFGIVRRCGDGVTRRSFPRFNIHSADYVEKILATCLKYFAKCPCPRCLVEKDNLEEMGTLNDFHRRNKVRVDNTDVQWRIRVARKWVFQDGTSLKSVHVKRLLDAKSLTLTRNAFSTRLADTGFNFYAMYLPDLLHEFELGVWKSVLTHLVRILHAAGGDRVQLFNHRYRRVPTFGRNTIRRFCNNMADLKKMAARDFEDALQSSNPVFYAILDDDEDNDIILDMLFDLSTWHALAKLRLHTDNTIDLLDVITVNTGASIRRFARVTCPKYATFELPRESAARGRRKQAQQDKGKVTTSGKSLTRKRKNFSMTTYKYHTMWDYAASIREVATTDNFTSQTGECEHRKVKSYYPRTNKNDHAGQIAMHVQREGQLREIDHRVKHSSQAARSPLGGAGRNAGAPLHSSSRSPRSPTRPKTPPELMQSENNPHEHTVIASSERDYEDITAWVQSHHGDPAFEGFLPRLRAHIFGRLQGHAYEGDEVDFLPAELNSIRFISNRIYHHRTMRVNYTTYDMQRAQDVINPQSHADVMLFSHEDDETADSTAPHPYWYARVVHIFHITVCQARLDVERPGAFNYTRPQRLNVVFIRWFGLDPDAPLGFQAKRLPQLGFVPHDTGEAFGFLDPDVIIRGAHLVPLFHFGHTDCLLPPSVARAGQNVHEDGRNHALDYQNYYVNIFVDRDMFMRYLGGAVGHSTTWNIIHTAFDDEETDWEDEDEDENDLEHGGNASGRDEPMLGDTQISSEEDARCLVARLGEAEKAAHEMAECAREGSAGNVHDNVSSDDSDREGELDEEHGDEDDDAAGQCSLLDDDDNEGYDDVAVDEYGDEGYAPL